MSTTLVEVLIVGAVCAVIGYTASQRVRRRIGVTPWRLPSWLWAALCAGSFIVGFILMAIAAQTTKMPAATSPPPTGARSRIASPRLANVTPLSSASDAMVAGRGWYPDNYSGRGLRYWDGRQWTAFVASSREALLTDIRFDSALQRGFLAVWGGLFMLGWVVVLVDLLAGKGNDRVPLGFAIPWLIGIGVAVPWVLYRAVDRLELRSGELSWRGLLRRGSMPVGDLRRISLTESTPGFVRIQSRSATLYVADHSALCPFFDVVTAVAPGVEIDPQLFAPSGRWRPRRTSGRFSTADRDRPAPSENGRSDPRSSVQPGSAGPARGWRTSRSQALLALIGVVMLGSAVTVVVVRLMAYLDQSPTLSSPGSAVLHLESGTYVLFERAAGGGSHGCSPRAVCASISSADVAVRSARAGSVRIWNDPSTDGITRDGLHYAGAVEFAAPAAGADTISVRSRAVGRIVVALQPAEEADALSGWLVLAGAGLLFVVVALVGRATAYRDQVASSTRPTGAHGDAEPHRRPPTQL